LVIALVSYVVGSFIKLGNGSRRYDLEFAKGFIALLISGFYLRSGLTYLMASVGMLAGQSRPMFSKANGNSTEAVALGIVFYMSPIMGTTLLLFFLAANRFLKDYNRAVFATCLTIPPIALRTFRSDSYIIISMIIFASLAVQFGLPFLGNRVKPRFLYNMAIGTGVLAFLALLFFNKYVYRGFGLQIDIIRHGPEQLKYVALTFDDGPDPAYTPEILDILKEKDVRATFFLVGEKAKSFPEIAMRIVEEGHSIGNHTHTHKSLIPLSAKSTYKEIKDAETAIEEATGVKPNLFRPPRGVYSSYARKLLKEEGYTLVLWDLSAMDWAELAPKKIVAHVINKVKPGSIILLHDSGDLITNKGGNRNSTVKALPEIIDRLREQGYEFVTIDQMIFISELMETEEAFHEDSFSPAPAY